MLVKFTEDENVTWPHIQSAWISMLFEFLCRLVSHPFCLGLYVVRVSISLALFTVLHGSLFCPIFYVTWCICHLGLYWSLCCPGFYVTWSHSRSVWVSMLSEFLCHLVALPFCMGLDVVRVSMSLGLTSLCMVLYVVRVSVLVFFHLYVRHCVNYYGRSFLFSSPCQRQCKHLPSLGVRGPLTFHISIFSSEIPQPNDVKLGS